MCPKDEWFCNIVGPVLLERCGCIRITKTYYYYYYFSLEFDLEAKRVVYDGYAAKIAENQEQSVPTRTALVEETKSKLSTEYICLTHY